MKIYLASTYTRMTEIAWYAEELRSRQHVVTSVWQDGAHAADDDNHAMWPEFGADDLRGIDAADVVFVFTGSLSSRGGYHAEAGYAIGKGVFVFLVGPIDNCIQAAWVADGKAMQLGGFLDAVKIAGHARVAHDPRRRVYAAIDAERALQDAKHGHNSAASRSMPLVDQFAILTEEYVELAQAINDQRVAPFAPFSKKAEATAKVEAELTQVAAVAVAILESRER